ncbi:MAG: hypothetical protein O2887_10030 [Bacteroidetes bacterium]|nr:hypothetical protein [Bacteroidota bacterium]MDA1120807.1 hypothetical protein [Bacteroidota bacterium]
MSTFLIEIPHLGDTFSCNQVIKLFVESGSHLLSNAHWGCKDGVHKAWFISDFENKEEALRIIPAYLKRDASVVELVKFDKDDIAKFAEPDK